MEHVANLRVAFEDFLADREYQGVSPATVSFHRRNRAHFVRDTGVEALEDLVPEVIRGWLLDHRSVSSTTLATYDRSIRVTLNWFERQGYLTASPMRNLPKRRTPRVHVPTSSRSATELRRRCTMAPGTSRA
jgi:hypothetical protein